MQSPAKFGIKTSGKTDGAVFVFVHGWPDDESLWEDLASRLAPYGLCARMVLPNFGEQTGSTKGYDFTELADGLHDAVQQVAGNKKIVLIGHDWGAYLSYIFEKRWPDEVQALVTIDVGPSIEPRSIGHALFLTGYQWWLMDAWFVGKFAPAIGTAMSQTLARVFKAPKPSEVRSEMNYPYVYFWRDLILGKLNRRESLANYMPQSPTLFIYGGKKPYMFHTQEWCDRLQRKPKSKAVEFPESGHWLMLQEKERTASIVTEWLRSLGAISD